MSRSTAVVIFIPLVIGYQIWPYRLFWNKITDEHLATTRPIKAGGRSHPLLIVAAGTPGRSKIRKIYCSFVVK